MVLSRCRYTRVMRLVILFAALACSVFAQSTDVYRATHDALMDTFLPVEEFKSDAQVAPLLKAADEGIWAAAGQDPRFRQLIGPFTNMKLFGPACGIDALVREAGTPA